MTIRRIWVLCAALLLAGCADTAKDYDAAAHCQQLGMQPGNEAYDQCVKDEKLSKLMEQQREDYERMKQRDQDWKMQRY